MSSYNDLSDIHGFPLIFNEAVPRPGAVVFDDPGMRAIVMHPDEEPHLWMAEGNVDRAFLSLKRRINQKISQRSTESYKRLDELTERLALRHEMNILDRAYERNLYGEPWVEI